jgi:hypothetical protein
MEIEKENERKRRKRKKEYLIIQFISHFSDF